MLTMLAVLALLVLVGSLCFGLLRTIVFLGLVLGLLCAGMFVLVIAKMAYTIALIWLFCMFIKLISGRK